MSGSGNAMIVLAQRRGTQEKKSMDAPRICDVLHWQSGEAIGSAAAMSREAGQ